MLTVNILGEYEEKMNMLKKLLAIISVLSLLLNVSPVFAASSNGVAQTITNVDNATNSGSDGEKEPLEEDGFIVEEDGNLLEISDVWARASIPSSPNSAAYFKIKNNSKDEYVIVAASTMIANNVELHNSFIDEKGISRMTTIDRVIVPAESTIEFKPGGMHVMLFNLKKNIKQGDKFDLNIMIENDDPITVECEVRN